MALSKVNVTADLVSYWQLGSLIVSVNGTDVTHKSVKEVVSILETAEYNAQKDYTVELGVRQTDWVPVLADPKHGQPDSKGELAPGYYHFEDGKANHFDFFQAICDIGGAH